MLEAAFLLYTLTDFMLHTATPDIDDHAPHSRHWRASGRTPSELLLSQAENGLVCAGGASGAGGCLPALHAERVPVPLSHTTS